MMRPLSGSGAARPRIICRVNVKSPWYNRIMWSDDFTTMWIAMTPERDRRFRQNWPKLTWILMALAIIAAILNTLATR